MTTPKVERVTPKQAHAPVRDTEEAFTTRVERPRPTEGPSTGRVVQDVP